MAANPVRASLHAHLAADVPLAALVGTRIYYQLAPQGATFPLVTIQKQAGRPSWTFAGPPVESELYTVKGIAVGSGAADKAENIADAIDAALNDAALTIDGRDCLFCLRESDIPDFAEDDAGTIYRHAGALFRVISSE